MSSDSIRTLLQQALASINNNDLSSAYETLVEAEKLSPNNIEIFHLMSVIFGMSEDYVQSEFFCKQALAINNNAFVVHNNLGTAQKLQGKFKEAEESFQTAIRLKNDYIDAYANLINLFLETEHIIDAETLIYTALRIDRSNLVINLALGNLHLKKEEYEEAINTYENILDSQPDNTDAIINLGQIFEHKGAIDKALKYYHKALDIIPGYDQGIIGITSIMEKQGRYDEALNIIKPVYKSSPNIRLHTICARLFSRLKKYRMAEEILSEAKAIVAIDQHKQELLFELGDVLDKQADYEKAFSSYVQANRINRTDFNRSATEASFASIKDIYTPSTGEILESSNSQSAQPVFIVGMPRSGTTLVEQILASHSQFHGGGELDYIDDIVEALKYENTNTQYPHLMRDISSSQLLEIANGYIDMLNRISPDTRYITNKMPHNFLHLGLIQQLFPAAQVIHCTREQKDTVLSIFFHQFNKNHPYASDLDDLNFYYQQYDDLMKHWTDYLDIKIETVNYECLVNNPEQESRRLISVFDLEWEEDCLRFYDNTEMVNTPSYHQVKQPLYKNSINRHQKYEKYIDQYFLNGHNQI